ncbi:MAG TPA: DUF5117 domain-containing protein, partial [Phnomibacter sp.]|nr:DUF5117 domain-containing protein [Phnomibacter sp.]
MKKTNFKLLGVAVILAGMLQVNAQDRRPTTPPPQTPPTGSTQPAGNGGQRPGAPAAQKGPKPYKEVITEKAKSQKGLFQVHQVEDKYYLEIPDNILGRDILVVNRISRAAAANGNRQGAGYAGDIISESVIQFAKGPDDRLFINKMSYRERATDSVGGMYKSVMNSNIQPIVYSFDIKALSKDSTGSVVEITPLITSDNDLLFFDASDKRAYNLGAIQNDKSYIVSVNTYPTNLNIKTVKTYGRTPSAPTQSIGGIRFGGAASTDPATYELNSSLVLLPKEPMRSRIFDERVGYFASGYVDFDANPQGIKNVTVVRRWRLEPKPEDVEKYKRGELVE